MMVGNSNRQNNNIKSTSELDIGEYNYVSSEEEEEGEGEGEEPFSRRKSLENNAKFGSMEDFHLSKSHSQNGIKLAKQHSKLKKFDSGEFYMTPKEERLHLAILGKKELLKMWEQTSPSTLENKKQVRRSSLALFSSADE